MEEKEVTLRDQIRTEWDETQHEMSKNTNLENPEKQWHKKPI